MKSYSLRSRGAGSSKKGTASKQGSPDKLDDAELDQLAKAMADFMKKIIAREQKAESKIRPVREDREPQSLQSGFEDELEMSKEDWAENITSSQNDIEKALQTSSQDQLLAKSVLRPDLEKQHAIPPYSTSRKSQIRERKKIRDSKAGEDWYDMKATEMTPELANDLRAIRMRSVLDPKRFYRKGDMKATPKFVQVGKVLDSPLDFYHARLSKKDRKQTLVEELLADADTRRYNKRKYMELQIHRSKSKRRRRMLTSFL